MYYPWRCWGHCKKRSGSSGFDILNPSNPYGLWIPYTGYSTTTLASGKVQTITDYAGSNRSLHNGNTFFQPTWYASQNGWGIGATGVGGGSLSVQNATSVTSFTVAAKLYLHQNAINHHLLSNNNMDPLFLPTVSGNFNVDYYSFNFVDESVGLGSLVVTYPQSVVGIWRYNATTGLMTGFIDGVKQDATEYSGATGVSSTFNYVGRLSGTTGLIRVQALCAWSAAHDDSTCADICTFLAGL